MVFHKTLITQLSQNAIIIVSTFPLVFMVFALTHTEKPHQYKVHNACKSFSLPTPFLCCHIHPSTSESCGWDFSLLHMEDLSFHAELSWDLGMKESVSGGEDPFLLDFVF